LHTEIWESYGFNRVNGSFPFQTLDEFCASHSIERIDLIKIDTDGFEIRILTGGRKSLMTFKPVVIVESETDARSGQYKNKVIELLSDYGYLHLGTLDGNNEIFCHAQDLRVNEFKRAIKRPFKINDGFLARLTFSPKISIETSEVSELKFRTIKPKSRANMTRLFRQKYFKTSGIPWDYAAVSKITDLKPHGFILKGFILGSDANTICISENDENLFTLVLPSGYYSSVLVPFPRYSSKSGIKIVLRNGPSERKSYFFNFRILTLF